MLLSQPDRHYRRFWPVRVGTIDLAGLRQVRDQLWAEAVAAFKAGEKWWLSAEVEKAAAAEQAERRIVDPWEFYLAGWLDALGQEDATVERALDALGLPKERHDQASANRVARIFKALGWVRVQRWNGGDRYWAYRPPSPVGGEPSPVGGAATGDAGTEVDVGVSGSLTGLTGLTSSSHTHRGDSLRLAFMEFNPDKGGGVPPGTFQKMGVRTGETGEPQLTPPPWTDDRAWIAEITRASGRDAKIDKVMAWGRAAGGEITTARGTRGIALPPNLPGGMALNELRRFARELHIETEPAEFTL